MYLAISYLAVRLCNVSIFFSAYDFLNHSKEMIYSETSLWMPMK